MSVITYRGCSDEHLVKINIRTKDSHFDIRFDWCVSIKSPDPNLYMFQVWTTKPYIVDIKLTGSWRCAAVRMPWVGFAKLWRVVSLCRSD